MRVQAGTVSQSSPVVIYSSGGGGGGNGSCSGGRGSRSGSDGVFFLSLRSGDGKLNHPLLFVFAAAVAAVAVRKVFWFSLL